MTDNRKTYKHWIVTLEGHKLYLGYDFYLGYEAFYGEDKKALASNFYASEPFDIKSWINGIIINRNCVIINRGVEEVLDESL